MAHLTLAGVSDDGQRLVLVSDAGIEFTVDIDTRLRAALRGETARLGQLEIQMTSALRPRDIQARIRSGETPEAVAEAAQTTVEKIMAYAGPVLAERQHVAQRAQRSSVRRRAGESAGSVRTLGDAVEAHLRAQNVDPGSLEWDAWRRDDGRWVVTGVFSSIKRAGTAQFTFDAPGNFAVADNDDAVWLLGDQVPSADPDPETAASRDDLRGARQRRLSSVPEDQLAQDRLAQDRLTQDRLTQDRALGEETLGDDAIELVQEAAHDVSEPDTRREQPVEAFLDDEPITDEPAASRERDLQEESADAAALDQPPEHAPGDDEPPSRRPVKKNRGRASVPSWDEIMFGGGKQD